MSLLTAHHRLAAWADSRLLQGVAVALLATDLLVGLNWALSPPETLLPSAYDVAMQYAPVSFYGLVLLLAAAITSTAYATRGRSWGVGYLLGGLLAGFWVFWSVIFGLAPFRTGAILAVSMAALHVLAGLALSHRAPLQPGGGGRS